ncbi:unnamed protein product [Orchesella dallaii]|uniref:SEC14-like protein 2 n=1 Tax=Orchesella dallaii TaxID=48710 RepID=A0ABP1RX73_9HEXA
MAAPTPAQQEAVNKLKEQLVDIASWEETQQDNFLLRWLKTRDMDVEKTKEGLLQTYKWRQENKIDSILQEYTADPELVKLFPYQIVGYDKESCPILIHDVQKHNPKKIIDKYGKEGLVKFADYNIEKIAQACRDKNVQQIFIIIDAKKFTFKQMTAPGATELALDEVKRLETHYPDGLKQLVVVNAPKVAKLAYKIVKPFVAENTIKRVKLFPKCNAKVQKFLLQYIDADQLPEKYGGTQKIGEAGDKALLEDDEDISGNPEDMDDAEDMVEAKVAAGKKLKLEYQIDQPQTQICWSFQTDDREIGFSVYTGEKEDIIVPYQKFGSLSLQNSSITCEKAGKYTLCFNNKENRFRSTTLSYMVSIFPPGSADDDE